MNAYVFNLTTNACGLSNATWQAWFPPGTSRADLPANWTGSDQDARPVFLPDAAWCTVQFTTEATAIMDAGTPLENRVQDGFLTGAVLWVGILGATLLARFVQSGKWSEA